MRLSRSISFGLAAALAALLLSAADARAGVNGREAHQRARIRAGVADGSLTGPEARRLARNQVRTERLERRMRADDGRLGPHERARLDRRLDHSSARIWRQRHDPQDR